MRKAIRLVVTLWIEGEAEPARDFFASTSRAVRDMIKAGRSAHPELKVTVKRVVERDDEEDSDEDVLGENSS